jgi:hypothetical protein
MSVFSTVCDELGVPLAAEKTIGPATVIIFLGLEIDTNEMVVRIPIEKITETKEKLVFVLNSKKVTLRTLQSLIGLLNFCARAILPVRAFNRRFCGVKKPDHFIRLSVGMKEDITVWLKFLDEFNGLRKFGENVWLSNEQLNLYTDSSGSANRGCGVYFCGRWAYFPLPVECHFCDIMLDMTFWKLVPILLAIFLFKNNLVNKQIIVHTRQ